MNHSLKIDKNAVDNVKSEYKVELICLIKLKIKLNAIII